MTAAVPDNTFIIIYGLRACNKVIGDIYNRRERERRI
jgi:hypothetical protein